jgi:hypothetical protein
MTAQELYERRAALVAQMREHLEAHPEPTAEDETAYAAMEADLERQTAELRRRETLERIEREQAASTGRSVAPADPGGPDGGSVRVTATPEYRAALNHWLRTGDPRELRSMNITVDPSGGYLVPDEFQRTMLAALNAYLEMRQYATVIPTSGDRDIPVANQDGVAYWTDEEDLYTESDETFAQRTLRAHKLTRLQKVSEELTQDSAFDIPAFREVYDRLVEEDRLPRLRRKLSQGEAGMLVDRHQDPELLRCQVIAAHAVADGLFDAAPRGRYQQANVFIATGISSEVPAAEAAIGKTRGPNLAIRSAVRGWKGMPIRAANSPASMSILMLVVAGSPS